MLAPELGARYATQMAGLICISCSLMPMRRDLLWIAAHRTSFRGHAFYRHDELMQRFAQMRADPDNADFSFMGRSFHFWSSYLDYDPMVDLRTARYPIIYLNGSEDEGDLETRSTLLSQLRSQGVDFKAIDYPGQDHEFKRGKAQLFRDILDWAKQKKL